MEIKQVMDSNRAGDTNKSSAFILETEADPYFGSKVALEVGSDVNSFAVRRVPGADQNENILKLFPGVKSFPAAAFTTWDKLKRFCFLENYGTISFSGSSPDSFTFFYPDPLSRTTGPVEQTAKFLLEAANEEEDNADQGEESTTEANGELRMAINVRF
jgi:hypothetical protein